MTLDGFSQIESYLFQQYYLKSTQSDVTSSHWRKYGRNDVRLENGRIVAVSGWGFGDFASNSLLNRMRYLPERILIEWYLRKYKADPEILAASRRIIQATHRLLGFDCAKQVLALQTIFSVISQSALPGRMVCVIGDGYGYFSSLIKVLSPTTQVVCVNLGKQLLFDVHYISKLFSAADIRLLERAPATPLRDADFLFVEAERCRLIAGLPIVLFVNIASMQEMNPDVIEEYFELMRTSSASRKYFYCLNRTRKVLPDGTIVEFDRYPWEGHRILLDQLPGWYAVYPSKRPPFWRKFDGDHRQRLTELD